MTRQAQVYVDTSVVSYLTARPSRDPLVAERQRVTRRFWAHRGDLFDPWSSVVVEDEASRGDPAAARRRIDLLSDVPILDAATIVEAVARDLVETRVIAGKAYADAVHLAFAIVYELHFLVTWDRRHLANPLVADRLISFGWARGFSVPAVCTPDQLMDEAP